MKLVVVATTLLLLACAGEPLSQTEVSGERFAVSVGQTLSLKLQTIGPGEYASPPEISSAAIRFVAMSYVGPAVPAGPTQEFRFRAVAHGLALISFRHTGMGRMVQDTVDVR